MNYRVYALFFFLILSGQVWSQDAPKDIIPYNEETQLYTYTDVVQVEGVSSLDLFKRAAGFAKLRSNGVTETSLKDSTGVVFQGTIAFKFEWGKGQFNSESSGEAYYTMNVQVKEGRYKYTINHMTVKTFDSKVLIENYVEREPQANGFSILANSRLKNKYNVTKIVDAEMKKLIDDLEKAMAKTKTQEEKTDW